MSTHLSFTTEEAAAAAEYKIGENLGIYPNGLISRDIRGRQRPEMPRTTAFAEILKRAKEEEWYFPKPAEPQATSGVKDATEVTPDSTWVAAGAVEITL